MKAKYYLVILSVLLLSGMPVKAQYPDNPYHSNGGATVNTNNYYDGNDYYYSSRINRFHRSYVAFEYYSPVFTSTYWYGYTPFSWGLSTCNGGFGFNPSYNFYYPVYYSNTYYFDYGWNHPFWYNFNSWGYTPYYESFCGGYDSFFYTYWYAPYAFPVNYGPMWAYNYKDWNGHNNFAHKGWNDNRPDYHSSTVNGHNDHQVPKNPARNDNTYSGSSRQNANVASRQRIPSSDTRRTVAERPGLTSIRPDVSTRPDINTRPGYEKDMNSQPENRRNAQLTAARTTTMNNQSVSNNIMSQPSERTAAMNNLPENRRNYSQSLNRSNNMDKEDSRSADNSRRK